MTKRQKEILPPRMAQRLLLWFLRPDLVEEVQGDLTEKFYRSLRKKSPFRARLTYWYEVFHYMRPFAMRRAGSNSLDPYDMMQSYFRIGVRNLVKSRFFSFINIGGMAISMAIFMIISLYILDELKFDKHIQDAGLKFRVFNEHFNDDGSTRKGSMIPPMVAPTLMEEYPQVEYYTRYLDFQEAPLFEARGKRFTEDKGGAADPGIFDMFSLELLEGDRRTALKEPKTVAISHTLRKKYFGDKPAMGEAIEIFDQHFKVVAVFRDFSPHTHFQRNFFLAFPGLVPEERMRRWSWNQFHTYIKLKAGTDWHEFGTRLRAFAERHAWPVTKPEGGYYIPHLMPITDVHLHAYDQAWDIAVRGNIETIYILVAIAAFILVIAVLNFVNLSTARAISRTKEVGVRKVMGAIRTELVYQFISESVLIAVIAVFVAGMIASAALPYLNAFTGKMIPIHTLLSPQWLLVLVLFGVVTGAMAGIYPALLISAPRPALILSGRTGGNCGRGMLRQGLVVFQFILSFVLVIVSFVVSDQYTFMRGTDIGFDKENLIVLPLRGEMNRNLEATKRSFADHPNIVSATLGYGLPGQAFAGDAIIDKETSRRWHINLLTVDHDYVKTLGMEIIAGRDFSPAVRTDESGAFILSEAAARMLGHAEPSDAVGHALAWNRWDAPDSLKEGRVIGIVKDIQLNSLREDIAPVALQIYPFAFSTLTLRIKSSDVRGTVAHLRSKWKEFNSEWPFEYKFLDENFDVMYKAEERLATLFRVFTAFTILVACLGLFGLVVYGTSQRYREISIRKILGANEPGLVLLFAGNYMTLIAIAFAIAIPLSHYVAWRWLQTFAFRIDITAALFVKAGGLIMVIALLTVGIQAYKASLANPVDALKER